MAHRIISGPYGTTTVQVDGNGASGGTSGLATPNGLAAKGQGYVDAAIGAVRGGLDAVLAGGGRIRSDTDSMRDQARMVNAQGEYVNMTADELQRLATTLTPYADKLGGYGDDLSTMAESLMEQSNDAFGQAGFLARMDPNATGLAAEFLKHYQSLSPDRYVSRAASDAQSSAENAMAQGERALARRGVSAGSGAALSLRQQYDRALAELTATAKTKAWDAGNKAQGEFLGTMTGAAQTFYGMGTQGASQALAAKSAAGDAQKGAAGIIQAQGGLVQDAGSLRATAGQLFASAAQIFGSAAGIETDCLRLTESSYKNLSDAFSSAADYYLKNAQLAMGRGGGGGSAVGGRHIGIGGEVLETGDPKIDALLSMVREGQMSGSDAAKAFGGKGK